MNTYQATTLAGNAPVTEPPISLDRTYRTRGLLGFTNPVRLLMVDGGGDKPVIGAFYVEEDRKWETGRWTADGRWFGPEDMERGEACLDLVEAEGRPA